MNDLAASREAAPVTISAPHSSRSTSSRVGLVSVVGAAVLLGTTGTAAELGPDTLGPETAASWRTLVGALVLVVVCVARTEQPWRYPLLTPWVPIGAASVAVNQLAFFAGVDRTGVAVGTLVTLGAVPVAAGLIDLVLTRRSPPKEWFLGVSVSMIGVALLTGGGRTDWLGITAAAGAGAAAAFIGLSAQRLMADRPVLPAMATVVSGGAALLGPFAVLGAPAVFESLAAMVTVAFLGAVTMAAAYVLWGMALERLSLATVAGAALFEPAVAAALALALLGEPVTATAVLGIVAVIAGVAVTSRRPTRSPQLPRSSGATR